ncbi:MAG: PDZ domain-containing protein [Bacteroidetes bacterium]|nr:PDZ domain-containing protein [Bacteroidota bacterium]
MAGISIERTDGMKDQPGYLGATFVQAGNKTTISFVERNTPAWTDGLDVNDEVLGVDDQEPGKVKDYLNEKKPGDKVTFKILRFGTPMDIEIVLAEPSVIDIEFSKIRKPSVMQKKVYDKFLPPSK